MRNPAAELHTLFKKWADTGSPRATAFVARGLHQPDGAQSGEAFDEHIRAMRLLAECQTMVDQMEASGTDVETFRRMLRLWAGAIMHYPYNWQAAGEVSHPFKPHAMDTLSTLAILLDARGPIITDDGMERLRKLLDNVKALLIEDESISADMRGHVYSVVQTLNRYLDDVEMYGQAEIRDAIRDLWVSLNAAAGESVDDAKRSKWKGFAQEIGIPAVGSVLGSIPSLALEALSLAAGGS
ncbi:hypothetical protein [Arthrobacter humicola]